MSGNLGVFGVGVYAGCDVSFKRRYYELGVVKSNEGLNVHNGAKVTVKLRRSI